METAIAAVNGPRIQQGICWLRGDKVMLSSYLAGLYEVETRVLMQSVKRNLERFPPDFMFQVTPEKLDFLRSQNVILNEEGRGQHSKYLPYAFTEQGVAMLSTVLRSKRAVRVNIEIMRTFVRLRQIQDEHQELARKVEVLERKDFVNDQRFEAVFQAIQDLSEPEPLPPRRAIGFPAGCSFPGDAGIHSLAAAPHTRCGDPEDTC